MYFLKKSPGFPVLLHQDFGDCKDCGGCHLLLICEAKDGHLGGSKPGAEEEGCGRAFGQEVCRSSCHPGCSAGPRARLHSLDKYVERNGHKFWNLYGPLRRCAATNAGTVSELARLFKGFCILSDSHWFIPLLECEFQACIGEFQACTQV